MKKFSTFRPADREIPITPPRDPNDQSVVVLIPGLSGTSLGRSADSLAWGHGHHLIRPDDSGYQLAKPITDNSVNDSLQPIRVIDYLKFFGLRKRVYGPIISVFEKNGYTVGNLEQPQAADNLLLFAYDWRDDNLRTVKILHQQLEDLRQSRGIDQLEVKLIGNSNGGHICRYYARYADAELSTAEQGGANSPKKITIKKIVLIASNNGGSIRSLKEMHRGRRYVPGFGRRGEPETLITFRTLIQDLPDYRDDFFLDENGNSMNLNLFDTDIWQRYEWSIFSPAAKHRLANAPTSIFGSSNDRLTYLQDSLDQARRFRSLLRTDESSSELPKYYMIQNRYQPTPERAVVFKNSNHWDLAFTGDKRLENNTYLHSLVTAGGDSHGSTRSQWSLNRKEIKALQEDPYYTDRGHFRLSFGPAVLRRLMEFISDS